VHGARRCETGLRDPRYDFMGPLLYLNTDEYQTLAYGLFSFKTGFGYKFLCGVVVTGVKG